MAVVIWSHSFQIHQSFESVDDSASLARHRQHRQVAGARAGGPQAGGLWGVGGGAANAAFRPRESRLSAVPAVGREGAVGFGVFSCRWPWAWFRRGEPGSARASPA
jgi:hypothetical protein